MDTIDRCFGVTDDNQETGPKPFVLETAGPERETSSDMRESRPRTRTCRGSVTA